MNISTPNIRKAITYTFLGILILGFYEYLWSDLPSFWQKISMIVTAVFLFSLIKEFVFWIFSRLSNFWSFVFKSIIVIFGFLLSWFYIFSDYSDSDFKENHIEIRNDIRNFFALPTSSPFLKNTEDVLIVPSSKEAKRSANKNSNKDKVVNLLLNTKRTTDPTENNTEENKSTSEIIKLLYIKDANKNWKTPIQKELYKDEELIFSRKLKSKINTSLYKPTATILAQPPTNKYDIVNYLYFKKTPVQVTYPQNFIFKNQKSTEITTELTKNGLIEETTTTILNTENKEETDAKFQIYTSGKLFNKYVKEFTSLASSTSNTFYIESTTLNEVQYVTFFAGKCWVITLTKNSKNNTLDDFYKILIPAVFEAQD